MHGRQNKKIHYQPDELTATMKTMTERVDRVKEPVQFPKLPDKKFEIIYADPPWNCHQSGSQESGRQDTGGRRSTVMPEDLRQLDVESISANNSLLFMWSSDPCLDQAMDLGKDWGFKWATIAFVWDKTEPDPGPGPGPDRWTLSQSELCLVFKRGKIPKPRGARNVRQLVQTAACPHAVKPIEVERRIEHMFPSQSKIRLFDQEKNEGNDTDWYRWRLE
jgi:N6-adenosine-specific RNA methylase IME4